MNETEIAIRRLVEQNPNWIYSQQENGNTPLMISVSSTPSCDATRCLLALKSDISAVDTRGNSAIHLASKNGLTSQLMMLLEYGADLDARNTRGDTPLILATEENHTECVDILLSSGADPNLKNNDCRFALDIAISLDLPRIAHKLANIADPKNRESNGWTALHLCAIEEDLGTSQVLIEKHGPQQLQLQDLEGRTPLQLAVDCESKKMKHFLENELRKLPCPNNGSSPNVQEQIKNYSPSALTDLKDIGIWD